MTKYYFAYLLRVWQIDDPENSAWRASLEDPHTRQVTGFASLEALWAYVVELVGSAPGSSLAPSVPDKMTEE